MCQQTGPTQAIPAEALTAEKAKMPAPITAPARDLLSAVIFNPPVMLSNVKLTAQLDLGSSKTGQYPTDNEAREKFQLTVNRWLEIIADKKEAAH